MFCSCKYLRSVVLNQCVQITDQGIIDLVATRPPLIKLDIRRCAKISDAGIQSLAIRYTDDLYILENFLILLLCKKHTYNVMYMCICVCVCHTLH